MTATCTEDVPAHKATAYVLTHTATAYVLTVDLPTLRRPE